MTKKFPFHAVSCQMIFAATLVSTVSLAGSMFCIYGSNWGELCIPMSNLLKNLIPIFAIFATGVLLLLACVRKFRWGWILLGFCWNFAIALYLQVMFFYPLWGNRGMPKSAYWEQVIGFFFSIGIWFGGLILICLFWRKWRKNIWRWTSLLVLLVLMQQSFAFSALNRSFFKSLLSRSDMMLAMSRSDLFSEMVPDFNNRFQFASQDNIILLIVDSMGKEVFDTAAEKYPKMREILQDFTAFPNVRNKLARTFFVVPELLTGEVANALDTALETPDSQVRYQEYLTHAYHSERGLLYQLKESGFRNEVYPLALIFLRYYPQLIDNLYRRPSFQPLLNVFWNAWHLQVQPHFIKYLQIINDPYDMKDKLFVSVIVSGKIGLDEEHVTKTTWDMLFYRDLESNFAVMPQYKKMFKYFHLQGAHFPYRNDKNLQYCEESLPEDQLRGSFHCVDLLLTKLREAGVYDNATIIVVGDHTPEYTAGVVAFIKKPHEKHDQSPINNKTISFTDIHDMMISLSKQY